MDSLEERLRGLRLREPSAELDRRVWSQKPVLRSRLRRPIPLWSAGAAAAAMALIGFALGQLLADRHPLDSAPSPYPSVQVHIVTEPETLAKMFDFTQRSQGFQRINLIQDNHEEDKGV